MNNKMKFVTVKKRTLIKASIAFVALVGAILGVYFSGAAPVFNNNSVRNHPIYSVETDSQKVALSFDASWGASRTNAILDVLATHNLQATFFITGTWAERNSEELKALVASERVEFGTHSNTHAHMTRLRARQIEEELTTSISTIESLTGTRPTLFRAPYGEYSDALLSAANSQQLTTIQWDVDGQDWKDLSSYDIATNVVANVNAGSIIRLHNDGRHTADALSVIIVGIQNRGLTIVPVGELIHTENYTINSSGRQLLLNNQR